jgi:tetratricopeptide (TPR) repeat protein
MLGNPQGALECYEKALKINPNDPKSWCGKGVALDMLGNPQGALECFDKALEINPNYFPAWSGKGVALGTLGKYQEAITCYDKALGIDPTWEGAKILRQKAIKFLRKAHEETRKEVSPKVKKNAKKKPKRR